MSSEVLESKRDYSKRYHEKVNKFQSKWTSWFL